MTISLVWTCIYFWTPKWISYQKKRYIFYFLKDLKKNVFFSCSRQKHWIEQSIKNILDDPDNDAMTFVSEGDIKKCFIDDQILVLEAPLGADLSVGRIPNKVNNFISIMYQCAFLCMCLYLNF